MGKIKQYYKPERAPARTKGVLVDCAPVGCADATRSEILMALSAVALESGLRIGRGGEYDQITDRYTVIGKGILDGKACDAKIDGATVADVIIACRMMRNGTLDPQTGHLLRPDSDDGLLLI